ncbi:MAG: methylated-DNA--[protein]-cysteine S-methyltransferase [Rikenellaceae bacterium]|jgi:AraC family transcriptional regulator of adaptative response/methylated-DNA-[protein]-cysteine methyltransferase|nr:methylated-DNA--[protein]-cysteine S-methyltransferase [Rikenellaceae bacterium]
MVDNQSCKDVPGAIPDAAQADAGPSGKAILGRMIDELPDVPWADIEILDWQPADDRLPVEYTFADTSFGRVLAANTPFGVCYLGLAEGNPEAVLRDFQKRFGYATQVEARTFRQKQALDFLDGKRDEHIVFHLRGTPYQTGIWRRLIRIPSGRVVSYATLGGGVRQARAAGTANGRNPIFRIVPCHRAVKNTGGFDRYFWGEAVKRRLLAGEFIPNKD